MTPQMLIDIMQESFKVALLLSAPSLVSALIIGVLISVFQAVTSIQEQTLVLVPKMVIVLVSIIIFFSWMLNVIMSFTQTVIMHIPDYIK